MSDTLQEALIKSSIMNGDDGDSVPSAVADAPLRKRRYYWHLPAHDLESGRVRYRAWYSVAT